MWFSVFTVKETIELVTQMLLQRYTQKIIVVLNLKTKYSM